MPGAQLLWDGEPLATRYTSSSQLSAEIGASRLATGRVVEVTVRNPGPNAPLAPTRSFVIEGRPATLYLPLLGRD